MILKAFRFQPFQSREGVDEVVGLRFGYDGEVVTVLKDALRPIHNHVPGYPGKHAAGGWLGHERCWFIEPGAWPAVEAALRQAGHGIDWATGQHAPSPPSPSPPAALTPAAETCAQCRAAVSLDTGIIVICERVASYYCNAECMVIATAAMVAYEAVHLMGIAIGHGVCLDLQGALLNQLAITGNPAALQRYDDPLRYYAPIIAAVLAAERDAERVLHAHPSPHPLPRQ